MEHRDWSPWRCGSVLECTRWSISSREVNQQRFKILAVWTVRAPNRLGSPATSSGMAKARSRHNNSCLRPRGGRCYRPRLRVPPGSRDGGVAERLKAHAWKVCMRETVSRVRIPPPPPRSTCPSASSRAVPFSMSPVGGRLRFPLTNWSPEHLFGQLCHRKGLPTQTPDGRCSTGHRPP
jgi:hypothetical protein